MRRFTTGIRSEKCIIRRFCHCANVYLHKPEILQYSLLHTMAIWYSLLLLGYKPVQHVTVLNAVGNCNIMVSIIILWDHHCTRWFKYDRDYLCVNKPVTVPVIFEPPCICGLSFTKTFLCSAYLYLKTKD